MIYNNQITTLADLARVQAENFPDDKGLIFQDETLTYSQLNIESNRVANALLSQGIKKQSRVALLAKDSFKSYTILFGCAKINAVLVPINWRLAALEINYILRDANVEVIFVGSEFKTLIETIINDLEQLKKIIILQANSDNKWLNYDSWCLVHSDVQPIITIEPNDVAVQIYTSGTTGQPKGVQLGHYSFFAIAKEFFQQGKSWINWQKQDKSLIVLPFFHIGGLWWAIRGLAAGAENILLSDFDSLEVLKSLEKYRITKTCMVPAMIQVLLSEPNCKQTDFSSLLYIVYGGSPIAESSLKAAIFTFGCKFVQIYGMTETGNCAVSLPADAHTVTNNNQRLQSVGKPFPGVSVVILDSQGREVSCHQVGEICIKSPANMIGYWQLPEATANTLVNGWIHTGDAGYFDEDGYIYICDRIKDMICYAGENIYPAEIENILYAHPAVAEVAVIGVPDVDFGESIKAIIVLKKSMQVTALDIIQFIRGKLANFKLPRSVEFVESLPRTPSGKLQKGKLREKYWQSHPRQVN